MPYMYNCPRCGTTSRLYMGRYGAQEHGRRHRRIRHGGDFPTGERIEHVPWRSPSSRAFSWRPTKGDAIAIAVTVFLVVWGVWHQVTT
ncbi:hypothetical protein [Streptomyces sp. NPDC004296]|uniref:hypothetical protein n=1 Tax=Streptomyces sp. NPDC004296 TaxID=3364697 RepID=UPI0036CFF9B7